MPALTPSILSAQIRAARAKTRGDRPLGFKCPDPWSGPSTLNVDGTQVVVRECRSDLEAREAFLLASDPSELVLLVRHGDEGLADDTRARLAKGRLLDLNPRDILLHLTGAQAIDARLLMHKGVIELLLQRWVPGLNLVSSANLIEAGRVFAFLLNRPALAVEPPDLLGLLLWSLEDGLHGLVEAPPAVLTAFFNWLRETCGGACDLIAAASTQRGDRLVSLGLVLGLVFPRDGSPSDVAKQARIRLERVLGDVEVLPAAAQAWQQAAAVLIQHHLDKSKLSALLPEVDGWLDELRMAELAIDCDFSPRGFDLRRDDLADTLLGACRSESVKSWDAMVAAEARVRRHALAGADDAMDVLRMALRLVRWLRLKPASGGALEDSLGSRASRFLAEGAFVDWARSKVRRGARHDGLNKALGALLTKVDDRREGQNLDFARSTQEWIASGATEDGVIPIEDVIDKVLAPVARENRVLLLVMDGMNAGVFAELVTDMEGRGWHLLRSDPHQIPRPILAALPSTTEYSRAALFRGRLDAQDRTSEVVNFREHPSLFRPIQSRSKPQLFLKANLADSGGAGLSADVRAAITTSDSKVVAVVSNAVDDQLSTLGQLSIDWKVSQIMWLKDILDAAAVGQRLVVLLSDHGHVPDKESDRSRQLKNTAGDRHRQAPPDAGPGELACAGPRLQATTGDSSWVLTASEGLRYAGRKSGYHGGIADQEVVVPLAILTASPDDPPGFESFDFQTPEWWLLEASEPEATAKGAPPSPGLRSRKKKPTPTEAPPLELWEVSGVTAVVDMAGSGFRSDKAAVSTPSHPTWIESLLRSDILAQQRRLASRTPVTDESLRVLLALLEQRAGVVPMSVVARELGMPQFRVSGFLAQVQRLLNLEGYAVLNLDASQTLRLNRDILFTQFDLKS